MIGFWLKHKIESPRFIWVSHPTKNDYVYKVRVVSKDDLDNELLEWLKEAYIVGRQEYKIK